MTRSRAVRMRAFALIVALMGGGLGLPLFDSLVFHSQPGAVAAERTLARPGGPLKHIQVCPLQHNALPHGCPTAAGEMSHATPVQSRRPALRVESFLGRTGSTLPLSRAPPVIA